MNLANQNGNKQEETTPATVSTEEPEEGLTEIEPKRKRKVNTNRVGKTTGVLQEE